MEAEQPTVPSNDSLSAQQSAELLKTQAETQVVKEQLSLRYDLREWLKALTGLAAIGALVWSMVTGVSQLRQAREDRQQENLDRALTRIASASAMERLVGVNSIRSFLVGSDEQKTSAALMTLAGGMVQEEDLPVRAAMLAALQEFQPTTKTKRDLQYALSVLLNGNRNLLGKQLLSSDTRHPYSGLVSHPVDQHLNDLVKASLLLIRRGATNQDFSDLYCSSCDFSQLDLHDSTFENALLMNANFEKANLRSAAFAGTVLRGANFRHATLQKAAFSGFFVDTLMKGDSNAVIDLRALEFSPDFSCSDLTEANFSGLVFWGFWDRGFDWEVALGPVFAHAKLDNANFSDLSVYFAAPVSDHDTIETVLRRAGIDARDARGYALQLLSRQSGLTHGVVVVHQEAVKPAKIVVFSLDERIIAPAQSRPAGAKDFLLRLLKPFMNADLAKANANQLTKILDRIETDRMSGGYFVASPQTYGGVKLVDDYACDASGR